jgi:RES domain-containing protein
LKQSWFVSTTASTCDHLPDFTAYAGLTGEGARLYGGRFNPPDIPAVYSSQSIALAVLEILVHIDKSEVQADYVVMAIQFPGLRVFRRRSENLIGVNRLPIDRFKAAFYRWPVLRVPSVIVHREYNFVLLPQAVGFSATIEWVVPLSFDRRLFSLRS